MFKLNAERALARHMAGAGPASPASGGDPGNARSGFSFSSSLRDAAVALSGLLLRLFDLLLDWQERSRQRHILMGLDDRMLRDIGLSRAEAEGEYRKPCWRP